MVSRSRKRRIGRRALGGLSAFFIAFCVCNAKAHSQTPTSTSSQPAPASPALPAAKPQPETGSASERPLPEINSLMVQVEAQEKASRKTIKQYIYRMIDTEQDFDSHGAVKKTTTVEREFFCVNVACFNKLLARDGKPLSGDELKKEDERIDQRIAEAKERNQKIAAGEPPPKKKDSDEITFARFLELGTFSNPRRVQLHGRDTIAIDYTGDPHAKSRNVVEGAIRNLAGTVWVDEQDHALVRIEAHFFQDYKVVGGLLADVHKGASFQSEWTKVNNEVWLPASFSGRGSARIALFFNHSGVIDDREYDYRKFRASSTILPGVAPVETPENTDSSTQPNPAR
jgi:hypothetical protein